MQTRLGQFLLPESRLSEGRPVMTVVYVFGMTIALLALIFKLALNPEASSIAGNTIEGAYGLLYVIVVTFLATNAVDRSRLLDKVGDGVKGMGTKVQVLTPDEMRRISGEPQTKAADVQVTVNTPQGVQPDG